MQIDVQKGHPPRNTEAARLAFEEALRYRKLNLQPQAAAACLAALGHDPLHTEAWRLRASLLWLGGRRTEAVDVLVQAAAMIPADPPLHADLGFARLALNRPAEAIPALTRAAQLNPALARVHQGLGSAYKQVGRYGEAEAPLRRAIELDPGAAAAHLELGEVLEAGGRLQDACESLQTALQLDPRSVRTVTALAKTLLLLGDYPAAIARYREAAAADPQSPQSQLNLGVALRVSGDATASLEAHRRAAALAPDNFHAQHYLSDALLHFGRPADAVESARAAVRLNPASSEARMSLGTALAAVGDLEGGIAEVRSASPPGTPPDKVLSVLSSKLVDAGATDASLEIFKRLLQVDPRNPLARHLVAARTGGSVERDPTGYVRALFDSYADTFDDHLKSLGYSTPQKLLQEIDAARDRTAAWDVLDLGCGTGLFGVEIAPRTRRLVGVDVSAKMIGRAETLGIYTQLRCVDLLTALEGEPAGSYDLVVAADVFVYVGRLDSIVPAVRTVLRQDGLFAFSVEVADGATRSAEGSTAGFVAGIRGRYGHTVEYLDGLAERHDFRVARMTRTAIRTEGGNPVMGCLLVWQASRKQD